MTDPSIFSGYLTDLLGRLDGPLQFRFYIQPCVAAVLAIRDGAGDARSGRSAYGWTLLTDSAQRRYMLADGWKGISKVFILACVLDIAYQIVVWHGLRPLQALPVAILLAVLPYVALRGPVNRLLRARASAAQRRQAPAPDAAPSDRSTDLAHRRTDLAVTRSYLAANRTLLAWIRTAMSMISFGFTIGKLGQAAQDIVITSRIFNREWGIDGIAYSLVALGTLSLTAATAQHWVDVHRLRALGLRRQPSLALIVAVVLILVGAFALGALVLQL